jgi:hypothetical protein
MFINHANETTFAPAYTPVVAPLAARRLLPTKSVWSRDQNESPVVLVLTGVVAALGGFLVLATLAQAFV